MHAPASLAPAFGVIRRYNPDLYAKMSASDWTLHAGPDADVFLILHGAEAGTHGGRTRFSLMLTGMTARELAVPADDYRAVVLAHEFTHVSQDTSGPDTVELERPAFAAMTAMASVLPPPYGARIIARVDEILAAAERGETAYAV